MGRGILPTGRVVSAKCNGFRGSVFSAGSRKILAATKDEGRKQRARARSSSATISAAAAKRKPFLS